MVGLPDKSGPAPPPISNPPLLGYMTFLEFREARNHIKENCYSDNIIFRIFFITKKLILASMFKEERSIPSSMFSQINVFICEMQPDRKKDARIPLYECICPSVSSAPG